MPHPRNWFAVTVVALAPAALIAAPFPVKVERFEGEVVQVDGRVHSGVLPGRNLQPGSQIQTGPDGRAQLLLHDAPTLAVGGGADLLLHSIDQAVLRLRIASGALRLDTRAAGNTPARDVRINAGDLRLRIADADAWIEHGDRGGQVCLISGVVEAQQPGGMVRLDTPGQCLRQSGLTSQWSMVPIAVLEERIALLQVKRPTVASAPRPPRPQVKTLPLPVESGESVSSAAKVTEPSPPPVPSLAEERVPEPRPETNAAPVAAVAAVPVSPAAGQSKSAVDENAPPAPARPPAVVVPPAPKRIEVEAAQVAPAPAGRQPVKPEGAGPAPELPADPQTPAAAQRVAVARPLPAEVPDIADPPTLWRHVPPVIVIETPAEAEQATGSQSAVPAPPSGNVPEPGSASGPALSPAADVAAVSVVAAEAAPATPAAAAPSAQVAVTEPVPTVSAVVAAPAADDGRRWRVVLGSMPEPEKAELETERLNARGWAVEAREYRVGDRHGYRIGFGEFATRDEAQRALEEFVERYPEAPAWLAKY